MADSIQTDPEQSQDIHDIQDAQVPVQNDRAPMKAGNYEPLFQEDDEDFSSYSPPRRRGRRIFTITLIVVLLLALIGGGTLFYIRRQHNAQVTYTQSAVTTGNLAVTVSASGPLKANAEYDMNFSASGTISQIDVKVGQTVKAGQVLAKLNSTSLQDALAQAQQNVNNAQVVYNDAVNNGASQTQLDQDNNSLQSAQVALKTAQDNLNAATLTAPGNATVASINGIVGQTAGSGSGTSSSSSSAFIVLVDLSSYTITSQVNEADIANVQIGQPARFNVNAYPNLTFRATVSSIGLIGTTSSSVVTYPVTLTVDMNSVRGAHLYPGMTATANITTAQRIGATLVSNAAFSFTTTALQAGVVSTSSLRSALSNSLSGSTGVTSGAGNQRVVLELKNGQLTPVLVTVGLTNGSFTEVLSGLQPNDSVVVGATGGPFANLSSGTTGAGLGGGLLRNLGGGNGGTRNGRTTTGG